MKKHAWYSHKAHQNKSFPLYSFNGDGQRQETFSYLWWVTIDGEDKLASHISEDYSNSVYPDSVYLGSFEGDVKEAVRADKVPIQTHTKKDSG
jgi:hypothetical protein